MKKCSEIKLTDDERKLLEVLKSQGYESIGKELYPGEECHSGIFGRTRRVQNFLLLDWFDGFDWMDYNDEYEIEKLLNPPHEPKTVWELEKGDTYWLVGHNGKAYWQVYKNSEIDLETRSQGNAFLTKEEAEFEAKRREVVAKVRKYARPFKPNCKNWYPYWDCNDYLISHCFDNAFKSARDYFESAKQIDRAIAEVGEDDFKKYYLGVVEDE